MVYNDKSCNNGCIENALTVTSKSKTVKYTIFNSSKFKIPTWYWIAMNGILTTIVLCEKMLLCYTWN